MNNHINLTTLAWKFTNENYLPMARDIQYQKVLEAMTAASILTMDTMNKELSDCLKQIQQNRIACDQPK